MNESISDVLVDTYRDILRVKAGLADPAKPGTRGIVGKGTPGSRLKSWHRQSQHESGIRPPLRVLARVLQGTDAKAVINAWHVNKGETSKVRS